MKRLVRIVCLLLALSMFLAIPASAAEQASDFFMSHSCYLWEVSDSEFQVWFDVTAVGGMDVLGASEIHVEQSSDRVNWSTVASYYDIYGYNRSHYGTCVTYSSATSGNYYRAQVTFYAENDEGIGEYTAWTSSLHY